MNKYKSFFVYPYSPLCISDYFMNTFKGDTYFLTQDMQERIHKEVS